MAQEGACLEHTHREARGWFQGSFLTVLPTLLLEAGPVCHWPETVQKTGCLGASEAHHPQPPQNRIITINHHPQLLPWVLQNNQALLSLTLFLPPSWSLDERLKMFKKYFLLNISPDVFWSFKRSWGTSDGYCTIPPAGSGAASCHERERCFSSKTCKYLP